MGEGAGGAPDRAGLFASARGLVGTGVALIHTRLQLFGVELAEERARLLSMIAYGGAGFLCLAVGLIFLAVFFTVLLWDSNRLLALGVFSAVFLCAGAGSLVVARRLSRAGSQLFATSLAELKKDREALTTPDGAASP